MSEHKTITIADGVDMQQLGFGVWQVPDGEAASVVRTAIETGYRSIDTAMIYKNETGTGAAIRDCGVPRSELFVTTKLWNDAHADPRAAIEASLERLGLEQVDLYLIHWPTQTDSYVEAWRQLAALRDEGLTRAIGVCNFKEHHLQRILDDTGVIPAINQVELHPYLQQASLRRFHIQNGITTEAWSPIGQGKDLLADPVITRIAEAHGRSPAQIVIRWHLQIDNVVIPKSVTPSRIRENFAVHDFELDLAEIEAIESLDRGQRLGPDPDKFG